MTSPHQPSVDALAAAQIDDEDVRTLQSVAELYDTLDPVPRGLTERISFGITLDALHAEIAELQRSSDLVGVRSDGATDLQTITFTSASLTIMVTISSVSAERVRIDGWVAPGGGLPIELRTAAASLTTTADADGRFVFDDVPKGPGQFTLRPPSNQTPVVTPAIEL